MDSPTRQWKASYSFVTTKQVYDAASAWYGKWDIDSLCLAENRLMRGKVPDKEKK